MRNKRSTNLQVNGSCASSTTSERPFRPKDVNQAECPRKIVPQRSASEDETNATLVITHLLEYGADVNAEDDVRSTQD